MVRGPEAKEVEPFLTARAITLTADLKGKELSVAARAAFPDAAAAGKAKDDGAEVHAGWRSARSTSS